MKKSLLWIMVLVLCVSMIGAFSFISTGAAKKYEGVKLTVVTQPGPYIAGPLIDHGKEWTALTGGEVQVIEVPYEDLYSKIMTPFITKTHVYDMIVVGATWLPDFTPYLVTLDDYIANPDTNPAWDDILPAYREKLTTWEGKVYALTLDGDTHTVLPPPSLRRRGQSG